MFYYKVILYPIANKLNVKCTMVSWSMSGCATVLNNVTDVIFAILEEPSYLKVHVAIILYQYQDILTAVIPQNQKHRRGKKKIINL